MTAAIDLDGVLKGSSYIFLLRIFDRGSRVTRFFIFASLLGPVEIGLFTAAVLVLSFAKSFTQLGFRAALIQGDAPPDEFSALLDSAWTVQVLRGMALSVLIYVLAGPAARLIESGQIVPFVQVLAIVPILQGLNNPGVIQLERDMDFRTYAGYWGTGTLADLVISLAVLSVSMSAWGLILGQIARSVTRLTSSHVLCAHQPSIRFVRSEITVLTSFGRWIFFNGILDLVSNKLDDLVVAILLGPGALGIYTLAFRVSNLLSAEIRQILSRVSLPVLSDATRRGQNVNTYFQLFVFALAALYLPMSVGLVLVAPGVSMLFGPEWAGTVPLIRILAVFAVFQGGEALLSSTVQALGQPRLETRAKIARNLLQLALIYWMTVNYGTMGVAVTLAFTAIVSMSYLGMVAIKMIGIRARSVFRQVVVPGIATGSMALFLMVLELLPVRTIRSLVISVLLGGVVYMTIALGLSTKSGFAPEYVRRAIKSRLMTNRN